MQDGVLLFDESLFNSNLSFFPLVRALKKNAHLLKGIAVFSDDVRDGIKGTVFDLKDKGFASGKAGMEESVKFGIVAASNHPQVDMEKVNYSKKAYSAAPWNVITYCECHDNNVLWDRLTMSCPDATREELVKMQELALTIVLTSQGIPFLHAGTEFLRTKKGVENSYNVGDSINAIDWSFKKENHTTNNYIKGLIQMRKAHPAFRMTSNEQMKKNIHFDEKAAKGTIVYSINGAALKDSWKKIIVAFNGNKKEHTIILPAGNWKVAIDTNKKQQAVSGKVTVDGISAAVFYQE